MTKIGLSRTMRKVELRSARLVGENALDANVACSSSNYALNALAEDYRRRLYGRTPDACNVVRTLENDKR